MINSRENSDLKLEKLGIREIQERLEVSPIIADPGSLGSEVPSHAGEFNCDDGGGKHYECNIIKPGTPEPVELEITPLPRI